MTSGKGRRERRAVQRVLCNSRPSALVSGVGLVGAETRGRIEGKSLVVTRKR